MATAARSNSSQTQIVEFHKSRQTIITVLEKQNYDVSQYKDFSINDVNTLMETKQMDMLLKKPAGDKKVYVKYHLAKSLRPVNIYEYIEDLFTLEEVLKKTDELIVIIKDEPNDTIKKTMKNIGDLFIVGDIVQTFYFGGFFRGQDRVRWDQIVFQCIIL